MLNYMSLKLDKAPFFCCAKKRHAPGWEQWVKVRWKKTPIITWLMPSSTTFQPLGTTPVRQGKPGPLRRWANSVFGNLLPLLPIVRTHRLSSNGLFLYKDRVCESIALSSLPAPPLPLGFGGEAAVKAHRGGKRDHTGKAYPLLP